MNQRKKKLPTGIVFVPSRDKYRARATYQGKRVEIGEFTTLRDAQDALTIARADMARGVFVSRADRRKTIKAQQAREARRAVTVDSVFEQLMEHRERRGVKETTLYTYRSRYNAHIRDTLGPVGIGAVTPEDVESWFYTGDGTSRPTNVYSLLAAIFNYAEGGEEGQPRSFVPLIEQSPCDLAVRTTASRRSSRDFVATLEQMTAIADLVLPRYRLAVLLAAHFGLRKGELFGIRKKQFYWVNGRMWLRIDRQVQWKGGAHETTTKTRAGVREYRLSEALTAEVLEHLAEYVPTDDEPEGGHLVFSRPYDRKAWPASTSLDTMLKTAVDEFRAQPGNEKFPPFTWHQFRHSALTRFGHNSVSSADIKLFGGHDSDEVAARYQHSSKERTADIYDPPSERA